MMNSVAVIGCGAWGKNLVRTFAQKNALASVCDFHTETAKRTSETYQVPALSLEEILKSDIQGVAIATSAPTHYAIAKQAFAAGKHVYVEKPLALTLEEGQELVDLAKKHNRILMVGHLMQYHPGFTALKDLVEKGELGKLLHIYSSRLNLGRFRQEENVLWSFAPHDISMILALSKSNPTQAKAYGACHLQPGIEDTVTALLEFPEDLKAQVFVSWLHPFKEQKLTVIGEKGMAVLDDALPWDKKLSLYRNTVQWDNGTPSPHKSEPQYLPLSPSEPLALECQHFLDCMAQERSPITCGQEGLSVLKVLTDLEKSLPSSVGVSSLLPYTKHESSYVDEGCTIGKGTKIWHFSHIIKGTVIGENCIIGQNVMIGPDVIMGNGCKVQNNVSLYRGITLEDDVFCGPSCVFTNVFTPRAHIERKNEFRLTHVERGVTIGANATIVCGVRLGAYSFIGAGAVVTKDVLPHALVVGNPARQIAWMGHSGEKLEPKGDYLVCPREKRHYYITKDNRLEEVHLSQQDHG